MWVLGLYIFSVLAGTCLVLPLGWRTIVGIHKAVPWLRNEAHRINNELARRAKAREEEEKANRKPPHVPLESTNIVPEAFQEPVRLRL